VPASTGRVRGSKGPVDPRVGVGVERVRVGVEGSGGEEGRSPDSSSSSRSREERADRIHRLRTRNLLRKTKVLLKRCIFDS
jgi:hypothetical protein